MIKVGITGQAGFIGTHLYNFLRLKSEEIELINFDDNYFTDRGVLKEWVSTCDVIVHMAAMNRHSDPQVIYETNIGLVKELIYALECVNKKAHIIFSSSIQEEKDNLYGKSKKEGRELFIQWSRKNCGFFTGMLIPNVFGPFGSPFYNSVIATFCHQLTHGEIPIIDIDSQLNLIYVGELVEEIHRIIKYRKIDERLRIQHTSECKVSDILNHLQRFKIEHFEKGIFPYLNSKFEVNLFNTFRSYYDIPKYYPVNLSQKADNRGSFVETIKSGSGGQISFSITYPGITRGNHYHTRKIERFAVIKGEARIQLRKIGSAEVLDFYLSDEKPAYVDMPVWYTHNITNIGNDDLYTIFWINEFFDPADPDTFFEIV